VIIKIIGKGLVMNYLLKGFGLFGFSLMLCLFSTFVYGETMYVSDRLKLTLRTGPSIVNKILAIIESGQKLDVVELENEWARVQLPNGKEGWVQSRYLTPIETNNIKLKRVQTKHKNLMIQATALLEENNKLKAENKGLGSDSAANQKQLDKIKNDYEILKADAAEFLTLKSKYESAASQLAEQTAKAEKLEEQLAKLELNYYIKWFLAGSGVLIVGFLIGFSTKRQRRRPALA
jgi:SH3 domain protein